MSTPLSNTLVLWYAEHGRDLPWRQPSEICDQRPDAYRVWLSEIILQQTTVRQGTDYYLRFVQRWPSVSDLAAASEDEVLREWQGLGYYSRARNLHRAAQLIAQSGSFPSTYAELRALPGVGPYTAAAIASIAYGLPHAVVDGNVYRVLSRYYGIDTPIDTPEGRRLFAQLAQEELDLHDPARHNQALMDFGATQCTPHSPRCESCPLSSGCQALAEGHVDALPVKARRTQVQQLTLHYVLVHTPSGLYLRQRPQRGIWARLWELPTFDAVSTLLSPRSVRSLPGSPSVRSLPESPSLRSLPESPSVLSLPESPADLGTYHHQLTHRAITCHASVLAVPEGTQVADYIHISWEELDDYALPQLILNIIAQWRNKHSA